MDPLRRALFLVLFASVFAAEPSHVRAMTSPERVSLPAAQATIKLVRQLADTLASDVDPTTKTQAFECCVTKVRIAPQVVTVHPALEPHAFRLPPPVC